MRDIPLRNTSTMEGDAVNTVLFGKVAPVISRQAAALVGEATYSLDNALATMALRPFELYLEFTNHCHASSMLRR
jgi:hypothetical protein